MGNTALHEDKLISQKMQCEAGACDNTAKYALYKTYPGGKKKWLNVCAGCEQVIGDENEKMAKRGGTNL